MDVAPDGRMASVEASAVQARVSEALATSRAHAAAAAAGEVPGTGRAGSAVRCGHAHELKPWHPGVHAAALHMLSTPRGAGPRWHCQEATRLELLAARSTRRAAHSPCAAWRTDLAPPETHLSQAVARAVRDAPWHRKSAERPAAQVADVVGRWGGPERAAFCASACLLAQVWPSILAELSVLVRQVGVVDGSRIAGFTDFTTHGAIFVNRRRMVRHGKGVPAVVRYAEALVRGGTHTRCNAAQVTAPFLRDERDRPWAQTPPRPGSRPSAALFRQLVALVRSRELYARVLSAAPAPPVVRGAAEQAIGERYLLLDGQARRAAAGLLPLRGALTEHGVRVLTQVEKTLASHVTAAVPE
ncbi:hypothetical protein [Streptomyces sp. RK75]|uniref:hypothetical protein n=1 Tax=Streptomyces sp. RK75 TaxID=2824895 RepID=UPI001B38932C|nr:hypothetical protein [Streptomyces sp. RK75]MBQ0863692.1 hypothetical protein [Streptomyces sp. RK75]